MAEPTHAGVAIGGAPRRRQRSGSSPATTTDPGGSGWSAVKITKKNHSRFWSEKSPDVRRQQSSGECWSLSAGRQGALIDNQIINSPQRSPPMNLAVD